jgi:DNA repair and recombination RAD54-like protein
MVIKYLHNLHTTGREPGASDSQREKGQKAQADLSALVNNFILRRTNELLSKHLPPKVVQVPDL